MKARFCVFASGGGSNLQSLMDEESREPYRVELLVTDRPCGAETRAAALDRPALRLDFGDPEALRRLDAALAKHAVDAILLAGFLRLVPAWLCARYRSRILNIHPSLLPAFGGRGMYGLRVHRAVISSGAPISGATVHFVDERYDEGPIAAQARVRVRSDDDARSLQSRVLAVEHVLYPFIAGRLAEKLLARGPAPERADGRLWPPLAVDAPEEGLRRAHLQAA